MACALGIYTPEPNTRSSIVRLARSARRNVLALIRLLATGDADTLPGPVRAAALAAEDVDGGGLAGNGASDTVDSEVSDGDTGGGLAGGATVLVVLLDDDTVLLDVLEGDVLVGHAADRAGSTRDGLDTDTVVGVDDGGVGNLDVLDGVAVAVTDGTDGDTVTAGAGSAGEFDVLCHVNICASRGMKVF